MLFLSSLSLFLPLRQPHQVPVLFLVPGAGEGVERGEETGTLLQALCLRGEERGPWEEATGRWDRR